MSLPIGWGDRNNTMSEKDMQLGGAAANRFAAKPGMTAESVVGAYANDSSGVYKSSDDVRKYYYGLDDHQQQQQQQQQQQMPNPVVDNNNKKNINPAAPTATSSKNSNHHHHHHHMAPSTLPALWADRQKERDIQAQQYGVFSRNPPSTPITATSATMDDKHQVAMTSNTTQLPAEVALVKVATNTLQTLALSLSSSSSTNKNDNTTNDTTKKIPIEDKEAFATAIRQAMEAMAKHS